MKRFVYTLVLATFCISVSAQERPLQNAILSIKQTKGYVAKGVAKDRFKDSKDSLCYIIISDFQIQNKSANKQKTVTKKLISNILDDYKTESEHASASLSYVVSDSDSTSLPGYKTVGLYYAEGKAPYISESGHNYVSVRSDYGTDGYRLATCIEWWENAGSEFFGRIVEVRGPFRKDVYDVYSDRISRNQCDWIYDVNVQIYETQKLVSMWRGTKDSERKRALEDSINERFKHMSDAMAGHSLDSCDYYVATMLKQISRVPSYKATVRATTGEEWNLSVKELANAYSSMDVISAGLSWEKRLFTVDIRLNRLDESAPDLKAPALKKAANNYNDKDFKTFAVYNNFPIACTSIRDMPGDYGQYAIWCTKDSTYLAHYSPMGKRTYTRCSSKDYIRNSRTGEIYHILYTRGLKPDETFWVEDHEGDPVITVSVYPALPLSCTMIDIEGGPTPEFIPGTTGWEERTSLKNIPVSELQKNQAHMIQP